MNSLTIKERQEMFRRIDILRACPEDVSPVYLLAIETLALTGMRTCELYRLTSDRLDVQRGLIKVRAAKGSVDHFVPVPIPFITRLKAHYDAHGSFWPQYSESTANRLLRAFWERIRVRLLSTRGQEISLHGLRASFAQQIYQKTGDIVLTQQLLGHRSLGSTTSYMAAVDITAQRSRLLKVLS